VPRKRRTAKERVGLELSELEWAAMNGELPSEEEVKRRNLNTFEHLELTWPNLSTWRDRYRLIWAAAEPVILEEWVRTRPFSRPPWFWQFSELPGPRGENESEREFLERHPSLLLEGEK
jgi:hypothetical protein